MNGAVSKRFRCGAAVMDIQLFKFISYRFKQFLNTYFCFLEVENLGVMEMKNSKLMPGMGWESTER